MRRQSYKMEQVKRGVIQLQKEVRKKKKKQKTRKTVKIFVVKGSKNKYKVSRRR